MEGPGISKLLQQPIIQIFFLHEAPRSVFISLWGLPRLLAYQETPKTELEVMSVCYFLSYYLIFGHLLSEERSAFIQFVSIANICLVYLISPALSLKLTRNVNFSLFKRAMQLKKLPREIIHHVNLTAITMLQWMTSITLKRYNKSHKSLVISR